MTDLNEIGQEQYCAKFHDQSLREIAYNDVNGTVATCGDNCIKVVRMSDWKEIAVEYLDNDPHPHHAHHPHNHAHHHHHHHPHSHPPGALGGGASFEDLRWTADGRILSVSSDSGCLHNFMILTSALRPSLFESDSALASFFKPIPPWSMLLTVATVVWVVVATLALCFNVSGLDLVRAMAGVGVGV